MEREVRPVSCGSLTYTGSTLGYGICIRGRRRGRSEMSLQLELTLMAIGLGITIGIISALILRWIIIDRKG